MNNLKTIAAQFNLFEENNLPQDYQNYWDNQMNEYNKAKGVVLPQFLVDNSNFEIGLFFKCEVQDKETENEYKYIEHSYILVKSKDSEIICILQFDSKSKKYYLHPYYELIAKFNRGLSSYERQDVYNKLREIEPNYIGVFTEKKLNDWLNFCTIKLKALEDKYNEVCGKNEEGRQTVLNFIKSLNGKCEVKEFKNSWFIKTKFFSVEFNLDVQSGYLDKKIRFEGNLNDIIEIETI